MFSVSVPERTAFSYNAELRFRQTNLSLGVIGGDAAPTRQCQFTPAPEARALDGRD
jgi:hypothetical protein